MDLLHNYGDGSRSNSDCDSEDEDFLISQKEKAETKSIEADQEPCHSLAQFGAGSSHADLESGCIIKIKAPDGIATDEKKDTSLDFFGLNSLGTQTRKSSSNPTRLSKSSNSHIHNSFEVPDGEFWSDFTPNEELNSDQPEQQIASNNLRVYDKSQIMNYTEPTAHISASFDCDLHSQHEMGSFPSRGKSRLCHSGHFKSHPYSRRIETNPSSQNTCQFKAQSKEKRKLYYIHSKVTPYLHSHCDSKPSSKLCESWCAHEGAVNRLDWNQPNFSHLLATAGMDSRICVWNVWSSADLCVASLTCHSKAVKHVEWCQSGRSIFSCSYDRTAQITDAESGQTKATLDHVGFVTAGSLLPSNPNCVATGTEDMVLMWDIRTPQAPIKHFTYKEAFGQVQDLVYIADDRELVSCADHVSRDSADRSIMVWDVRSTAVLSNQVFQERYTCTRLKLHKEKYHFLAQTHGGYIALFSSSTPYKMEKGKRYGGHKLFGYSIGFDMSPDGKLVYSGSAERGVHCYDYRTGKLIHKLLSGCDDVFMDVACHPVLPSVLATCTWGGSIKLWQ